MKNTRKKLLVSSVAMLLVSAMALSTATFAWFTSSATATANKLSVRTIRASKLVISKAGSGWGDLVEYNADELLKPASTPDASSWFKANAAEASSFKADTDTLAAVGNDEKKQYVYSEQLNVANAGAADVENVKIIATIPDAADTNINYLRFALVKASEKGSTATNTESLTANNLFGAEETYFPLTTDDNNSVVVSEGTLTANSKWELSVGVIEGSDEATEENPSDAKCYNLYVWFEGQDQQCVDANAGITIPEIVFTVTGDTVEETTAAAAAE